MNPKHLAKLLVGDGTICYDDAYKARLGKIDTWLKTTLQQCGWNSTAISTITQITEEFLWHEEPESYEDVIYFAQWLITFFCMGLYQAQLQSEANDKTTINYLKLFCDFAATL